MRRIGHAVLGSPKNQETVRWFRDTLGLVCSDDVYAGDKENFIGRFSRIDAGDNYVDHHAFLCMRNERAGLNHFSFEVQAQVSEVPAGINLIPSRPPVSP
jgi:hypothetical protein